ncbi:MAG TPA: alkaline phosphatase family protein [Candidatus Udaeobacter sp.]|jgi:predicted AlkP superfamily pyrophosphatase or phosphodiesterase
MRRIISLLFLFVCASAAAVVPAKPERHVVVIVWDGMRPNFVTEQNTPTLWKLARDGVTFRNHHSVFPSATNVNGTAMVTGVYPGTSGIIANHAYRPDIDPHHAVDVELPPTVKKGDEVSGGKYLAVPTIADLVERAGARSVIAAAKTVGLLLDRHPNDLGAKNSVTLFQGKALPSAALDPITEKLGPFPSAHLQRDSWTTKALIDVLWKDGVPSFSILWLGEPDLTQHETAPGAPVALAAIKSSDENLAAVLSALDERKARETTDVFVVSDHGFSTIRRSIDIPKILNQAGFAAKTEFTGEPKPGDIMLAGNGGSVLFYVIGHDSTITRRLVEFLQQSDFAGVIFTKQPMEGTFALEQANIQNDRAPDVVMAFRWDPSKNQFDVPGMIDADWQRAAGKGTHATLSRFDMHNTLIAAGPDFKRGEANDLASGNVDLAPTILQILGIKPPEKMDGRILSEAMIVAMPSRPIETKTIEATKHFRSGTWRQSLQISRVGSTIYLDEGNGAFANEPAASELQRDR